jgi:hypothetical protein
MTTVPLLFSHLKPSYAGKSNLPKKNFVKHQILLHKGLFILTFEKSGIFPIASMCSYDFGVAQSAAQTPILQSVSAFLSLVAILSLVPAMNRAPGLCLRAARSGRVDGRFADDLNGSFTAEGGGCCRWGRGLPLLRGEEPAAAAAGGQGAERPGEPGRPG